MKSTLWRVETCVTIGKCKKKSKCNMKIEDSYFLWKIRDALYMGDIYK